MICVITTWDIPDSIGGVVRDKAVGWVKRFTKHEIEKWPDVNTQVLRPWFINTQTIKVMWTLENFEKWQEHNKTFWSDEGSKQMLDEMHADQEEMGTHFFSNMRTEFYDMADVSD